MIQKYNAHLYNKTLIIIIIITIIIIIIIKIIIVVYFRHPLCFLHLSTTCIWRNGWLCTHVNSSWSYGPRTTIVTDAMWCQMSFNFLNCDPWMLIPCRRWMLLGLQMPGLTKIGVWHRCSIKQKLCCRTSSKSTTNNCLDY